MLAWLYETKPASVWLILSSEHSLVMRFHLPRRDTPQIKCNGFPRRARPCCHDIVPSVLFAEPTRQHQARISLHPSRVAQLVEQVTVNHRVGGSSPSSGAVAEQINTHSSPD